MRRPCPGRRDRSETLPPPLLKTHGNEYLTPEAEKQVAMFVRELMALEKRTLSEEEQRELIVDPRFF